MKNWLLSAALLASGALALSVPTFAHGGMYRGPGDTVPPGGGGGGGGGAGPAGGMGGPSNPSTGAPTVPGAGIPGNSGAPGMPTATPGSGDSGPDLTQWTFWWEFNKDPYLQLKARIHDGGTSTGEGFFFGNSREKGVERFRPSEAEKRGQILPALLAALKDETNNDIVTGALIALAKIGDAPSESGVSEIEPELARFLSDRNQEISETAAVSLGILANHASIDTLEHLLLDDAAGRVLVRQPEVSDRTRAFAAYGLGLVGHECGREEDRQRVLRSLRVAFETDQTRSRDLRVACVVAFGLVPLSTLSGDPAPEGSRLGQLDYLEKLLVDDHHDKIVRAHCPTAMARLLFGLDESARERVAGRLLALLDPQAKVPAELVQSAVLALGRVGTNDDASALDRRIREALVAVPKRVNDVQARLFALVALAQLGGTTAPGAKDPEGGLVAVSEHLLAQLADGKSSARPWAGLACGVLGERLARTGGGTAVLASLQSAVRSRLGEEADPSRLGAYAIASGLMGDVEAKDTLLAKLLEEKDDTTRGYLALGLGLMNAREAMLPIQQIAEGARFRPDLLKQAAIALGLLGDKDLVPKLVVMLKDAKGLATQASLSSALGFIGDRRSIEPLVQMLASDELTDPARGFAAVALGIVGDKEDLPWNAKIALDLNYRAASATLTNQATGTGILDIL
jgi:HEAT repeat protein